MPISDSYMLPLTGVSTLSWKVHLDVSVLTVPIHCPTLLSASVRRLSLRCCNLVGHACVGPGVIGGGGNSRHLHKREHADKNVCGGEK